MTGMHPWNLQGSNPAPRERPAFRTPGIVYQFFWEFFLLFPVSFIMSSNDHNQRETLAMQMIAPHSP
jgi:prolipoprotein diacylglyceryltransferase